MPVLKGKEKQVSSFKLNTQPKNIDNCFFFFALSLKLNIFANKRVSTAEVAELDLFLEHKPQSSCVERGKISATWRNIYHSDSEKYKRNHPKINNNKSSQVLFPVCLIHTQISKCTIRAANFVLWIDEFRCNPATLGPINVAATFPSRQKVLQLLVGGR